MIIICFRKRKIIDVWQKTTNTGKSGASLIAYSKVNAFRFPETDQVYLTCNVEVGNIIILCHLNKKKTNINMY